MLRGRQTLDVTLKGLRAYRKRVERVLAGNPNEPSALEQLARLDAVIRELVIELTVIQAGIISEDEYDTPFLVEVTDSLN